MESRWREVRHEIVPLLKQTFTEFQKDKGQWLAAAIAYFTLFAVAPLIIVLVEIAGFVLGHHQSILNELYGYLSRTAGHAAADGIRSVVSATFAHRRGGAIAQIAGWAMFLFAAVGLFAALQASLNTVWDVQPKKQSIVQMLRGRALSFGIVLAIALLLLVSLGINTALTVASASLTHVAPFFPVLSKIVEFVVSFAVISVLFAVLYAFLPQEHVPASDVWLGAVATALLFVVGQFLLGWYLGRAGISSSYGSFGGIVVFLLWVNYSAQILLFGAEFTKVYAYRFGSRAGLSIRGRTRSLAASSSRKGVTPA